MAVDNAVLDRIFKSSVESTADLIGELETTMSLIISDNTSEALTILGVIKAAMLEWSSETPFQSKTTGKALATVLEAKRKLLSLTDLVGVKAANDTTPNTVFNLVWKRTSELRDFLRDRAIPSSFSGMSTNGMGAKIGCNGGKTKFGSDERVQRGKRGLRN